MVSKSDKDRLVVIVGAGVSGLSLAAMLADHGVPSVVIEKEDRAGGLARSFTYGDFTFDIGPHRFHTDLAPVEQYLREVLGDSARTITRESWLHFMGRFYPWPIHPWYQLLRFPPTIAAAAARDMMASIKKPSPVSFKDQIINMYGETLYTHFFEGYSSKFLGIVPELTHADWAKTGVDRAIIDQRVQMQTLWQLATNVLFSRNKPAMEFLYPAGGCEQFIRNLQQQYEAKGGEVLCGQGVSTLQTRHGTITEVSVGERTFTPSLVVWTGTVHSLASCLDLPQPEMKYLALVCYNLMLTAGEAFRFQWCYHGAADVIFSRVSVPSNFDPGTTPPGRRSICVEVTCMEGDDQYRNPERYMDQVLFDLKRENLLKVSHEVAEVKIERIPWAYPIYHINYRDKLAAFKEATAGFTNLMLAGRLGRFWYNNMDHCVAASIQHTEDILARLGRK